MTHCCGSFCLIGWHAMTLHDNDELSTYVSCCPLSSTSMTCSSSVSSTSSSSTSGSSTTCCIMKSMPASNFWRKEMHTKQIYTDCNRYKCHTRCHTAGEDSVTASNHNHVPDVTKVEVRKTMVKLNAQAKTMQELYNQSINQSIFLYWITKSTNHNFVYKTINILLYKLCPCTKSRCNFLKHKLFNHSLAKNSVGISDSIVSSYWK